MKTWLRLLLVLSTVGGGFAGLSYVVDAFGGLEKRGLFTEVVGLAFIGFYAFVIVAGLLFVYDPRHTQPMLVAFALQIPSVSFPVFECHISAASYVATFLVLPQGPGLVGTHVEWSAQLGAYAQFRFADLQEGPSKVGVNLFAVLLYVLLRLSLRARNHSPEPAPTLSAA